MEVAHDIQHQVGRYVTDDLHLINSFDMWHGTKNVGKALQKITQGRVRDRGKTWFPELVDKRLFFYLHDSVFIEYFYNREEHQDPSLLGNEEL